MTILKSKVTIKGNYRCGYFIEIEDQYTKQILALNGNEMELLKKMLNERKTI
jgi:hypothetical protein